MESVGFVTVGVETTVVPPDGSESGRSPVESIILLIGDSNRGPEVP